MPSPLESARLADLHALAAELGVERYRMLAREEARQGKPRRKQRPEMPMASMGDGMKGSTESRRKLAETQKRDASDR